MKILSGILIVISLFGLGGCQQRMDIKVMSYNIRHGEGLDNVLDLSRPAHIIQSQAPDLCGLQEVDNFCWRSDSVDQTNFLAQQTGTTGTFGKFMDFDGGNYGMATLSAKPIVSSKLLQLPDGLNEPRIAIVHEVELNKACTIAFANVHFDWIESEEGTQSRLNQAKALMQYINALDKAVIITGDFNCTPDSPAMNYFYQQGFVFVDKGEDKLSFQGKDPVEIDHVIYRNSEQVKFKANHSFLLNEPVASDHRPLVALLQVIY